MQKPTRGRAKATPEEIQRREFIAEQIKKRMKEHGLTQKELSNLSTVPQNTLSRYMNAVSKAKDEYLVKIAEALNVDLSYFSPNSSPPASTTSQSIQSIVDQLDDPRKLNVLTYSKKQLDEQEKEKAREISEPITFYTVNLVSKTAAASGFGRGFGYDDSDKETIQVDQRPPRHDIATRVSGDSMEPDYHDGDILYLTDKGLTTYNGELAVIAYGDRSYFKKIYTEKGKLRLVSLNDKYEDIILDFPPAEDTHIKIFAVVGNYETKK